MSSQVFIILLSRKEVAEFKDQVLLTSPQNLTTNKIKHFLHSINFFFIKHFSQFYSVESIEFNQAKLKAIRLPTDEESYQYFISVDMFISISFSGIFCSKQSGLFCFSRLHFRSNTCEFNKDFFFYP